MVSQVGAYKRSLGWGDSIPTQTNPPSVSFAPSAGLHIALALSVQNNLKAKFGSEIVWLANWMHSNYITREDCSDYKRLSDTVP